MLTYLMLNLMVVAGIVVLLVWLRSLVVTKVSVIALLISLMFTAVFDSLIIFAGIVAYNPEVISSVFVGAAPIEDFFYSIAAVIIMPSIWKLFEKRRQSE